MRRVITAGAISIVALAGPAGAAVAAAPEDPPCTAGTMHAHATVPHKSAGNHQAHMSIPHCEEMHQ